MFMALALESFDTGDIIRCSSTRCQNVAIHPYRIVKDHLFFKCFDESTPFGFGMGKRNLK